MRGRVRVGRKRQMTASRPPARRWTSDEQKKRDDLLNSGKDAAERASTLQRTRQAIYGRLQRAFTESGRSRVAETRAEGGNGHDRVTCDGKE
jgi:hypothetical protein